jgi:hypothetical protein
MADFFQSLSTIGDTLVKNRDRAERERTLADLGQYFGEGPMDYKTLGARLIAAGDIRNGLLALRMGDMREAGLERRTRAFAEPDTPAPSVLRAP